MNADFIFHTVLISKEKTWKRRQQKSIKSVVFINQRCFKYATINYIYNNRIAK